MMQVNAFVQDEQQLYKLSLFNSSSSCRNNNSIVISVAVEA
jgi:hypothetical protein